MPFLKKISLWLNGTFHCIKCGEIFHTFCFGFGECICPDCYTNEEQILFFDKTYWLNRLVSKGLKDIQPLRQQTDPTSYQETAIDVPLTDSELVEYNQH